MPAAGSARLTRPPGLIVDRLELGGGDRGALGARDGGEGLLVVRVVVGERGDERAGALGGRDDHGGEDVDLALAVVGAAGRGVVTVGGVVEAAGGQRSGERENRSGGREGSELHGPQPSVGSGQPDGPPCDQDRDRHEAGEDARAPPAAAGCPCAARAPAGASARPPRGRAPGPGSAISTCTPRPRARGEGGHDGHGGRAVRADAVPAAVGQEGGVEREARHPRDERQHPGVEEPVADRRHGEQREVGSAARAGRGRPRGVRRAAPRRSARTTPSPGRAARRRAACRGGAARRGAGRRGRRPTPGSTGRPARWRPPARPRAAGVRTRLPRSPGPPRWPPPGAGARRGGGAARGASTWPQYVPAARSHGVAFDHRNRRSVKPATGL